MCPVDGGHYAAVRNVDRGDVLGPGVEPGRGGGHRDEDGGQQGQ